MFAGTGKQANAAPLAAAETRIHRIARSSGDDNNLSKPNVDQLAKQTGSGQAGGHAGRRARKLYGIRSSRVLAGLHTTS